MSRNFELMTQLDLHLGTATESKAGVVGCAAAAQVVPILSSHAGSVGGEEVLRLIQRVFLSANGSAPRQVVLCGVEGKNGSSSVCAMIGRTLAANSSRPVCLVDANVRSPRLSNIFGVDGKTPLSGNPATVGDQCVKIGGNLWLAGPGILADSSRILLPPDRLKERLVQLRETFEYMLIDAPGTSVCGDAQLLGLLADAAILVVEANSTRRLTARNAKDSLDAAGVRLLGTVLNDRVFAIPEAIYRRL